MPRFPTDPSAPRPLADRRLSAAADLAGDADGIASPDELSKLAGGLEAATPAGFDGDHMERAERAAALAQTVPAAGLETLDPVLRRLPAPVRRLSLQIDALWGNADGELTLEEIDRVAGHYLRAVAFFADDAQQLLSLAGALGIDLDAVAPAEAENVLALRAATQRLDRDEVGAARPFRELFREAVRESDIPGSPDLLRDASLHSPTWHHLSILEHSTMAVRAISQLRDAMGLDWPEAPAVMLLHDVGKILDRVPRPDRGEDHYSYWDHEAVGAEWLKTRGVDEDIVFHVRHHMVVRPESADHIRALAGGDKDRLARMLVVFCADDVAKGLLEPQMESFEENRSKILELARDAGIDGEELIAQTWALKRDWFSDIDKPLLPGASG
jgi:putative nucleotidyltransferase with HDIG domain